jgi:hypothetical protein
MMAAFLEILKYILPSLVVLATTWYLVKTFLEHEGKKEQLQIKLDVQKISLPVRMQAYERLVLLLERLQPAGLIMRTSQPGMNASTLHSALLLAIREEFDHNLSQQLYVSPHAWELVKKSREDSIQLINSAAAALSPEASISDLAQQIFVKDMESKLASIDQAIDFIKKEAREAFFHSNL